MSAALRTLLILAALPLTANAQFARTERRILPEARVDVAIRDGMSVSHAGGGFHVNSGTYLRLALLAGYGVAQTPDASSPSFCAELQGRFHLDPQRASRLGLYGIGGLVATHDDFARWQTRMVAGAGVELPAHGRATLALEAALAGGFRITIVARRLPLGRR